MDDKEYMIDATVIVIKRILMINFIRFVRILIYNCKQLGAKHLVFLNCSYSKSNVIQHQATTKNT